MRRALIACVSVGLIVGGSMAGLFATGAFGGSNNEEPAAAKTADAIQTMVHATHAALPQATVDPNYTPPQSCPSTPTQKTGVRVRSRDDDQQPPPDFKGGAATTAFAVGSDGNGYDIAAGQLDRRDPRWFIRTLPAYPDYCAVLTGHAPEVPTRSYEVEPGPVTLTQIDGDIIAFQTGHGATGRLNFVTGTFVDISPGVTVVPTATREAVTPVPTAPEPTVPTAPPATSQ